MKLANVLLMPNTGKYGVGEYSKAQELIDIGYASAKAQSDKLLKYQLLAGCMEGVPGRQTCAAADASRTAQDGEDRGRFGRREGKRF